MNTFESSATSPTGPRDSGEARDSRNSSSCSPAHVDSGLSSSYGSNRSNSSFSSRKYAGTPRSHRQQSNESTPVFDEAGASTRNYGATEAPNPYIAASAPNSSAKQSTSLPNNSGSGGNSSDRHDEHDGPHQSWYSRFVDRFGSLELENKGSVARDHLALERTFLAWMRTSLAFASIGIAVTQLFRLNSTTASTNPNSLDLTSPGNPVILSPQISSSSIHVSSASSRLRSVGKPLGSTFIGVGILILIIGFHRYFESQYWIVRGKFPASRGSVAITAFVAAALIIAAFAVILAVSPGAVEQ